MPPGGQSGAGGASGPEWPPPQSSQSTPPPVEEHETAAPVKTRKVKHPGKSFSSRNPTPIGAIGLVLLLAMLFAAFNASSLPLIGGGTSYHAMFKESANLKDGDDVRIAGVKVGQVDSVSIATNNPACLPSNAKPGTPPPTCVKVDFTVKSAFVGDQSQADIKIKTVLGAKMLNIDSIGEKSLKGGSTIPEDRTTTPYDIYPAFTDLTHTVQKIDTTELAKSFETLAGTFKNTPPAVRSLVTGLSRLSDTISSRDAALTTLLTRAKSVTDVLVQRDSDLKTLLTDGGLLLDELTARRDAIHSLLINTQTLSTQLRGLVTDNQKTLGPLLDQLDKIFSLLVRNQENLDRGLALAGPFYRVFNNVVGNGRWFDNYIQNLNAGTLLTRLLGQ
jgi:phospholipid/cholesterol/gamma-HCH transport system substrate-binding protein